MLGIIILIIKKNSIKTIINITIKEYRTVPLYCIKIQMIKNSPDKKKLTGREDPATPLSQSTGSRPTVSPPTAPFT